MKPALHRPNACAHLALLALFTACERPPETFVLVDSGPVDPDAPAAPVGPLAEPSHKLSEVGLYDDIGSLTVSPDVHEYEPSYALWSDGLDKRRWIYLPEGTTIDVADQDSWRLPIGTKLFKQFSLQGRRIETRLIYKLDEDEFWMGSYVWNEDGTEAEFAVNGALNVLDTDHDVPNTFRCQGCHKGELQRVLGFTAVQLAHDGEGLNLEVLTRDGWANGRLPPAGDLALHPDAAALGYLHANCGSCHNPEGRAWRRTDMDTRIRVVDGQADVSMFYDSLVMAALDYWQSEAFEFRVVPGDPAQSAVYYRTLQRDSDDAMPPHSTELVDTDATSILADWITSLAN